MKLAKVGVKNWTRRFLRRVWNVWRQHLLRSQLHRASQKARKVEQQSEKRERRAVADSTAEAKKAKGEARKVSKALAEIAQELEVVQGQEEEARAEAQLEA